MFRQGSLLPMILLIFGPTLTKSIDHPALFFHSNLHQNLVLIILLSTLTVTNDHPAISHGSLLQKNSSYNLIGAIIIKLLPPMPRSS